MHRSPTTFETKVYQALNHVPAGKVTTYQTLGAAIGCNSAQAIGNALRRNPFAPETPCHRVIPATLTLGGYSGATSGDKVAKKRQLLASEGIHFDENGKLLTANCLLDTIQV